MGINPSTNRKTCCKYNPGCTDRYALKHPCLCKQTTEKCKSLTCPSVKELEHCKTKSTVITEASEKTISLCEKSCNTYQEETIQTEKVKKKKRKKNDPSRPKSSTRPTTRPISKQPVLTKETSKPLKSKPPSHTTQPIKGRSPSPKKKHNKSTHSAKSVEDMNSSHTAKSSHTAQAPIPSQFVENKLPVAPMPAQVVAAPVPQLPSVPVQAPKLPANVPVPAQVPKLSVPAKVPLVPVQIQRPTEPIPAQLPTASVPTQFPSVATSIPTTIPTILPMTITETKDTSTSTPSAKIKPDSSKKLDNKKGMKADLPTRAISETADTKHEDVAQPGTPTRLSVIHENLGFSEKFKSSYEEDADTESIQVEAKAIPKNTKKQIKASNEDKVQSVELPKQTTKAEKVESDNEEETDKALIQTFGPRLSETETIKAPTPVSGARSLKEVESLKVPAMTSELKKEEEPPSIKTIHTENPSASVASPIISTADQKMESRGHSTSEEIAVENLESAKQVESAKETAKPLESIKEMENALETETILEKQKLLAPVVVSSKPIVWVLGGPGSGKGTQCEKIIAKYGFTHLSTGDLLRAEVKSGSDRAKTLTAIMEKGELVPNEVVLDLLKEAMEAKMDSSNGFLIDGYPREESQGVAFEQTIAPVTVILYFEASAETLTKRLLGRAASSGRADDNEDTIKLRLKTFMDNNDKVLAQYPSKLVRINAERSVDEIFADVERSLDSVVAIKS